MCYTVISSHIQRHNVFLLNCCVSCMSRKSLQSASLSSGGMRVMKCLTIMINVIVIIRRVVVIVTDALPHCCVNHFSGSKLCEFESSLYPPTCRPDNVISVISLMSMLYPLMLSWTNNCWTIGLAAGRALCWVSEDCPPCSSEALLYMSLMQDSTDKLWISPGVLQHHSVARTDLTVRHYRICCSCT